MKSNIEKEINDNGSILYEVKGSSMRPLIRQDKDLCIIVKAPKILNKYDVVLYKRDTQIILHRIIAIKNGKYVIAGDNCYQKEYDVNKNNIIGILKSVERNSKISRRQKSLELSSTKQKFYAHIWCDFFPVRYLILKLKHFVGQTKLGIRIKNKKAAE